MVNSPSVTLEPTPVNTSPQLSQQFVANAFDSCAHSKTAKCSWARNRLTAISKKSKKLYSPRALIIIDFNLNQAIDSLYSTYVDASPQLSQQFVDDAFDSCAHSKTAKRSWARNHFLLLVRPPRLYSMLIIEWYYSIPEQRL